MGNVSKEVHVYQGKQMTICRGADLCSAAPALPAFQLTVDDVFKLPEVAEETVDGRRE